ncbi:MAG: hypothetical protein ABL985_06610 [Casimicrobium sp.]
MQHSQFTSQVATARRRIEIQLRHPQTGGVSWTLFGAQELAAGRGVATSGRASTGELADAAATRAVNRLCDRYLDELQIGGH